MAEELTEWEGSEEKRVIQKKSEKTHMAILAAAVIGAIVGFILGFLV